MTEADTTAVDVFLSYSRMDRAFAQRMAEKLEQAGLSVWWDFDLVGGQDFRAAIRTNLGAAKRVVVLWSSASVESHFVLDEAGFARTHGKLVPVQIEDVDPPLGFGGLHTLRCLDLEADFHSVLAALDPAAIRSDQPAPAALSNAPPKAAPQRRTVLKTGLAGLGLGALGLAGFAGYSRWTPDEGAVNPLAVAQAEKPRVPRIALVISNQDYTGLPSLGNATNDGFSMARKLEELHFNTEFVPNASRATMQQAIQRFKGKLLGGGVGVFYYAGHGFHRNGRDYAAPLDLQPGNDTAAIMEFAIDISDMTAPADTFFAARHIAVKHAGLMVTPSTTDTSPEPLKDHGVFSCYATAAGTTAYDGEGRNGPFTAALIGELDREHSSIGALARAIRMSVLEQTEGRQSPVLEDTSTIDFAFHKPRNDPASGLLRLVFLDMARDNPFG